MDVSNLIKANPLDPRLPIAANQVGQRSLEARAVTLRQASWELLEPLTRKADTGSWKLENAELKDWEAVKAIREAHWTTGHFINTSGPLDELNPDLLKALKSGGLSSGIDFAIRIHNLASICYYILGMHPVNDVYDAQHKFDYLSQAQTAFINTIVPEKRRKDHGVLRILVELKVHLYIAHKSFHNIPNVSKDVFLDDLFDKQLRQDLGEGAKCVPNHEHSTWNELASTAKRKIIDSHKDLDHLQLTDFNYDKFVCEIMTCACALVRDTPWNDIAEADLEQWMASPQSVSRDECAVSKNPAVAVVEQGHEHRTAVRDETGMQEPMSAVRESRPTSPCVTQIPDDTPAQDLQIAFDTLPSGDSVFFDTWSGPPLPTPAEIRNATDVLTNRSERVVRFQDLGLIVKHGSLITTAEGQTLWFVRTFSDVPVPQIYGWCRDGSDGFVYMSLIEGETLEQRWPSLSADEKQDIAEQLRVKLGSLRKLRQRDHERYIGSLGRTAGRDITFCDRPTASDAFSSVQEFHDFLLSLVPQPDIAVNHDSTYYRDIRLSLPDHCPVIFTHGDLHRSNIMISREGSEVLAIIDWHQSGWYPAYWEWVKALWTVDYKQNWHLYLYTALEPFCAEFWPWNFLMASLGI